MNTLRFKKSLAWVLAAGALVVASVLSGCGSSDPSNLTEQHAIKVYVIGDMNGALADEIEQIFVNRVNSGGVSADAPVFVAANRVESLDDAMRKGILDTYRNGYPVVVVHGGEAQNNALLAVLGLEQNYKLPRGILYSELFAVDIEEGGHTFTWSTYPPRADTMISTEGEPAPSEYKDNPDDQFKRTSIFHTWLDNDGKRITPSLQASRGEAMKALSRAVSAENSQLTDLAKSFVHTVNFSDQGNHYQYNYYVYSAHSFPSGGTGSSTEYDWFYIRQEGVLNASATYGGIKEWYNNLGTDEVHYYVGEYEMNNFMDVYYGVTLMKSDPQNTNNVTEVTSGVEYTIGGSVGIEGSKASLGLDAGVTIKNETKISVSDAEVQNHSGSNENNAMWRYVFKKPTQTNYIFYGKLSEPPLLSRSNFQPVNQWIWRFEPAVRDSGWKSFSSLPSVRLAQSIAAPVVFWIPNGEATQNLFPRSEWVNVPLAYPPLLVVPHDVSFGAAAGYKPQEIMVARNWTASSNQAWCRVEPSSGTGTNRQVYITVDTNATGASRTANITVKTVDGKGSDTMTIFQAQY